MPVVVGASLVRQYSFLSAVVARVDSFEVIPHLLQLANSGNIEALVVCQGESSGQRKQC
jgi:hypothetical protein